MPAKEIELKHKQMFYPTVRVRTGRAGGSGTVVYSKVHDKEVHTYVITNHHVIAENIAVEKKWDSVLKKKVDKETLDTVQVEFFRYNNFSHCVGSFAVEADIVAYSEFEGGEDWALLRCRDKENVCEYVANIFPRDDVDNIHIFDEVFAVGASLGHPPIATDGHIAYMDDEIDHYNYWMSTAQTIFGNSGGAVYRWSRARKCYEYVGIPSRIQVKLLGFSADAITHMGYFIPIERIYKLLESNCFQFIYDEDKTPKQCEKMREKKREAARKEDRDDDPDSAE
jgi:hypothetical protein